MQGDGYADFVRRADFDRVVRERDDLKNANMVLQAQVFRLQRDLKDWQQECKDTAKAAVVETSWVNQQGLDHGSY